MESYIKKLINIYGSNISLGELLVKLPTYIDIYADGSFAFINGERLEGIGVYFGPDDSRNISCVIKGTKNNNQAEIIACIEASIALLSVAPSSGELEGLKAVKGKFHFVNMYTDSKLVTDAMTIKCRKTKYSELFDELEQLAEEFVEINWVHIKGHADTIGNIEADKLSRKMYPTIKS
jgi:ribonuclease HI